MTFFYIHFRGSYCYDIQHLMFWTTFILVTSLTNENYVFHCRNNLEDAEKSCDFHGNSTKFDYFDSLPITESYQTLSAGSSVDTSTLFFSLWRSTTLFWSRGIRETLHFLLHVTKEQSKIVCYPLLSIIEKCRPKHKSLLFFVFTTFPTEVSWRRCCRCAISRLYARLCFIQSWLSKILNSIVDLLKFFWLYFCAHYESSRFHSSWRNRKP